MGQLNMMARDLHHVGIIEATPIARYLISQGWRKDPQVVTVEQLPSVNSAPVAQLGLRERLVVHNG